MRSSIRAKLLAAFALDLLLMVSLGWFAAQQMAMMNTRATFVEQQTIPSLDTIAKITTVINRYRVAQLEYLIYSNPYDKDRSKQKMGTLETEMASHFAGYQPLITSDSEGTRFDQVVRAWQQVVTTNYISFIPAAGLANTGSVQPFYSRMNPLYDKLDMAMSDLAAEGQTQATDALEDVRTTYERARTVIMGDTALTSLISAVIGLMLSGRIALRIGRLTSATAQVAAGDLERKVQVLSRDELGALAQSFNRMVDSLREQRGALEQRNTELQASLRLQEQLTDDLRRGKQAEEEAQRAQATAEAASQAKSMFLATMSHELRTPLNAILGYAQLLRMGAISNGINQEMITQLDRIVGAGRHLTTVISNVLDFSKIEQGKIDLDITTVNVCALARESADIVDPLMRRQGNTLRVECPPDIGVIETDGPKLRQVLFNLLANAAKFTDSGEVTLRVRQEAILMPPASGLLFEVIDTGIGIAAEQQVKLFQPFSQIDSSVTRRFEGTGLGLALSRQLCLALGGDISVESAPGQGSTFRVSLPSSSTLAPISAEAID
ncbi:HAMP domain-containing protein [Oscillochloris sp. ZM17-4]|uniref:sensor histidine kinase n=1 Tax=Oscillochloris sp. ZM17-4 TaxID=2866714 RepID=UPI001C72C020|nr:ATP-binding protein [Oscillochloris sp. ZM17-4]MBX0329489.1 HAMP domain-containing protein [Oscillochloris sp. ZM17-4]